MTMNKHTGRRFELAELYWERGGLANVGRIPEGRLVH